MKKGIVTLMLCLLCCMSACGKEEESTVPEDRTVEIEEDGTAEEDTISENDAISENDTASGDDTTAEGDNRAMIAEALVVDENRRELQTILGALETINAGQLQSIQMSEEEGDILLTTVAEDGTNYCIYLTESYSLEGIRNLDTDEWPIMSVQ